MKKLANKYQFEVKWWPFQLQPDASPDGVNKVDMYCKKFGMSREQAFQMAAGMGQKFKAVGLPFNFTDKAVTSNTFNSHRFLTYAANKHGLDVQDKLSEELFLNYFGEEKNINDESVLFDAAVKSGFSPEEAKTLNNDATAHKAETVKDFELGKQMRHYGLTGVPFFIFSAEESGQKEYLCGAHPADNMVACIEDVANA